MDGLYTLCEVAAFSPNAGKYILSLNIAKKLRNSLKFFFELIFQRRAVMSSKKITDNIYK